MLVDLRIKKFWRDKEGIMGKGESYFRGLGEVRLVC